MIIAPLDEQVRDRILAEGEGNPLALLELPRALTPVEFAGGFGEPGAPGLPGRIEDSFVRRLQALPADTRRLLLVAAAEPAGDAMLVWQAAGQLGIGVEAAAAAETDGLLVIGARVIFRHPLVRSAVYRAAPPQERRLVHRALADATDPRSDPDRRAWHRAQAILGPDEDVAAELENSAGRAQARGGLAAAAAFLERSAALTVDPERRAGRRLAAARAKLQVGAFDQALDLLAAAEAGPLDEFASARVDLLRGQIAFASGLGSDAPRLLLTAAKRLEPLNLDLARETYLDAWHAAMFAGHLAGAGNLAEVSRAARALPRPAHAPRPADLLLDGLALWVTDGSAAAAPVLRRATTAFASADMPVEEVLRWGWMAREADKNLWDDAGWSRTVRQVQLARDAGALDRLPFLLNVMALDAVYSGDLAAAGSLIAEADVVCEATGSRIAPYAAMMLASFRGREAEAAPLIQATLEEVDAGGQGVAVTWGAPSGRDPVQRPGPSSGGTGGGPASQRAQAHICLRVDVARADRSRGAHREHAHGRRCPGSADRKDKGRWDRGRAGDRGALPRAAERGTNSRGIPSRGARLARPHAAPSRPRPRPPIVRGMAAPPGAQT